MTLRQASALSLLLDREWLYDDGAAKGYSRAEIDKRLAPVELNEKQRSAFHADLVGKAKTEAQ